MGLNAYIYKHNGEDFSNGGVSSRFNEVCLVNVAGPSEPDDQHPACVLNVGRQEGTVRVFPLETVGKWAMAGGCYVGTSDSRFGEAIEKLLGHRFYGAVALHDRVE